MKYRKVRVTLEIPVNYIPEGTEDPVESLAALLTAALLSYRIKVVKVNKRDLVKIWVEPRLRRRRTK